MGIPGIPGIPIYGITKQVLSIEREVEKMPATRIIDVLSAKDARLFVSKVDVTYKTPDFKTLIFDSKYDDDYLFMAKIIGSSPILIDDVRVIDDDFIDSLLR